MAEAKIILFKSKTLKDGLHPVVLRVTHLRRRKYYSLGFRCKPEQWNDEQGRVAGKSSVMFKNTPVKPSVANEILNGKQHEAENIIFPNERDNKPFSFSSFDSLFNTNSKQLKAHDYFEKWIKILKSGNKIGTAAIFNTVMNAIDDFRKGVYLQEIDHSFLISFENWLRLERQCTGNSISVYMRTLRSLINKAIKKDQVYSRSEYPFENYNINDLEQETIKRAVTQNIIKKIYSLKLDEQSPLFFAKMIFMFSYLAMGMNFIDIIFLKWDKITEGRIKYHRIKTKKRKLFDIEITPAIQMILDYYKKHNKNRGGFVFPIIDTSIHKTLKQQYTRKQTVLKVINKALKDIGELIGFNNLELTTYVTRHSYATHLNEISNISLTRQALGHGNERQTETYLAKIKPVKLDKANRKILDLISHSSN